MPPEYYAWLKGFDARDILSLVSALVAIFLVLVTLRQLQPGRDVTKNLISPSAARLWLLGIVLLGGILRFYHLGTQDLSYDEALSALTAQTSFINVLQVAKYSSHPPGYYLLLWAWSKAWGTGLPPETWIRFPSAVLGTLNLPLLYQVARLFKRPRHEALTAVTLMAVLPFQLFYAQEARMYQLLLFGCLVTLASYQSRRWWGTGPLYYFNLNFVG